MEWTLILGLFDYQIMGGRRSMERMEMLEHWKGFFRSWFGDLDTGRFHITHTETLGAADLI